MQLQTFSGTAGAERGALEALVNVLSNEVLPELKAYYPKAEFHWRGDMLTIAKEYARQLSGLGITVGDIRKTLPMAKTRAATESYPPNPIEFRHMCLHTVGMPTLDECMAEIELLRTGEFGPKRQGQKIWSCPFVYWLSANTSGSRAHMSDPQWRKLVKLSYSKLADKFAAGEIQPIPRLLESNPQPAYMKYMGKGAA
ncbi:replication protein P [Pseudoalteromonas rubra]|uniref:replication protein P n=1 Tax=Pseudoalteromonas rubra TaxID=43658 RepID=UPI000F7AAA3A|nr:replication protein P [Pseudoalteromonas rubra]